MSGGAWWTKTWNPVIGCSPVSAGCDHCWAAGQAHRGMHAAHRGLTRDGRWTGEVRCLPERLAEPFRWRTPQRVAVALMGDLFHERVPPEFIATLFGAMAMLPQHTFMLLTKRPERMHSLFEWVADALGPRNASGPLSNIWAGVSIEDQPTADLRIPLLLQTQAARRFVSYEPALGEVDFFYETEIGPLSWLKRHWLMDDQYTTPLDWVIVGGESGPRARPCDVAWIRSAVEDCQAAGVPVWVKQLGADPLCNDYDREVHDDGTLFRQRCEGEWWMRLRHRSGADMAEWPADLRVRELPGVTP